MENKLNILVVEDDAAERHALEVRIDANAETMSLVGSTASSAKALEMVVDYCPDAVILDLELQDGCGDGLDFLKKLKNQMLARPPFILITTNNVSKMVHDAARSFGADYIMTKVQVDYCADLPLEFLKSMSSQILNRKQTENLDAPVAENKMAVEKRYRRIINNELNKVGINPKVKGYTYLGDGILLMLDGVTKNVCNEIGKIHKVAESSVERAIQNCINRAWNVTDTNDLLKYYTAKINTEKGVPTLMEFMSYYTNKIKYS